jgi:hypothetical protein
VVARSLLGMPRIFHPFSADPQQIRGSMLELLKHNCRFSWRFFAGSHRSISFRSCIICKASRLSSWYRLGIFRSRAGTVEFNRKRRPSKRTGGRVFEVFTESPLAVPLGTLVSTLLRAVGSPTRPTDGPSAVRSMKAASVPLATDSHAPIVCVISDCTRTKCAQLHWIVNLGIFCVGIAVPDEQSSRGRRGPSSALEAQ